MFVQRAAILSVLLAGGDAFSPPSSRLERGASMSLRSSAGVLSTPAEVEKSKQEEDEETDGEQPDISIPYDATVILAYEATDKSMPYEKFKVRYLADAVADVIAKQPVDLSVPYDATVQLAFEASDRSMVYEDFKPKYLADAVAEVVAKQSGGDDESAEVSTPANTASAEEQDAQKDPSDETSASSETEDVTEEVTTSAEEETASQADETTETEEAIASSEEETKDEVAYYKRPVIMNDEEEEEKEDDVVYYKRKPLNQEDIYIWKKKTEAQKAEADAKRKEKEGRFVLKKNEERSIYVKNMDRAAKRKKPERKKVVRKTREEKRAEKEERKAARKARTGRRILTIREKMPAVSDAAKEEVSDQKATEVGSPKKEVKMAAAASTDNEGLFAPAVLLTKDIIGITELNKLRGKIIKLHSDVIGGLTETAQSEFGNQVLKVLFTLADKDKNGTIDEEELTVALRALGFDFLKEKEIAKIFNKADGDKNGKLDFEEWSKAAPPTLKKNLIKLAKKNGHELGFLAK